MNALLRKALTLACVAAALTGCSSLNPFAGKSEVPALKPIQPTTELRAAWKASVGEAGPYVFQPASHLAAVFAADKSGAVTRFEDGRQIWRVKLDKGLSAGVGTDGAIVVVATPRGEVIALNAADGQVKWRAQANAEVLAAPVISGGLVVVRSGDSRLFGFDAADGKRRWVYQRNSPPLALRSHAGVVVVDRMILAGFPAGKLVAVSPENGALLWEGTVAVPRGTTELERVADITSLPVLGVKEVCSVAYQGRLVCFDISNGETLWTRDVSSAVGLDIDERHVYVTDDKGAVQALDRISGASVWKQDQLVGRGVGRPTVRGAYVVVADGQGVVHLLRRDDGAFAARYSTDGSPVVADVRRAAGLLLVQTRGGGLYGLSAE
ncbi:MAG: outer membrane protein assembly factor BamB [Zoogloea sp.]|nr:outer membrane protein assembly factor BamB [Zoogloea sp.]